MKWLTHLPPAIGRGLMGLMGRNGEMGVRMALLATMYTMTTYGTWLRGDRRGWIDDGILMPPDPDLEHSDRQRMAHDVFLFDVAELQRIGNMVGASLNERLSQRILALAVQTWHVHFVVVASPHSHADIVRCAKEAVRYGLRPGRPIWTDKYDKRFCFDVKSLQRRVEYVERHNVELGWPRRPWNFIVDYPF
jgi:hypothetical protein